PHPPGRRTSTRSPTATRCRRCPARCCPPHPARSAASRRPTRRTRPDPRPRWRCAVAEQRKKRPAPDAPASGATGGDVQRTARTGGEVDRPAAYESLIEKRSGLSELLAPVAGFGVTFANMFKPTVTEQYPRE